jgi:TP901 family phage tail tape measure protein
MGFAKFRRSQSVANRYAIETVFKLIDQVSAPTSQVGRALDKLGIKSKAVSNALKRDFDKAAARVDRLGKTIKKSLGYLTVASVAALGAGLAIATKQFIDFDNALHKAGAIFSDLDKGASDFRDRLKTLGIEARNVAATTEFNAQQTANALATMAMAGIKSDQAVALLPKVADMATAAGIEIDAAVGMAADSLSVFGKMSNDPLILAENFQYVSDIMVKTASLANMDISMMYQAIGAGGGEFKKANQRIEDFGAAVAVLAANNIKGSEAGTAINTMMVRLAAPAKAGEEALKKLGVRTKDAQGNILNFADMIGQLNVAFRGMGTAAQADYIDAIFGKNRYQAASALITAGAEGLQLYSSQLEEAAGATAAAAAVMRQSLTNRIEVLKSSLTELGFKFVDAFAEKGGAAIGKITDAVNNFDITPITGMAQAAAAAIGRFAGFLMGAAKMAWEFRGVIIAIVAPIVFINGAFMLAASAIGICTKAMFIFTLFTGTQTKALATLKRGTVAYAAVDKLFAGATVIRSALMGILTGGTLAQAGATASMAVATGTATTAQWLLNAAMNANPIGVVILAITALIGVVAALVKLGDKATAVFVALAAVASLFIGPVALAVGLIVSMIVEVVKNVDQIKKAFTDGGIIEGIKRIGGVLLSGLLAPVQGFLEILSNIPGMDHLAGKGVEKIQELRNFLKGADAAAVIADAEPPKSDMEKMMEEEMKKMEEMMAKYGITMPDIAAPDFMTDYGLPDEITGRSKLHGVVDISGGMFSLPFDDGSNYSASSAVNTAAAAAAPSIAQVLTQNVADIAAVLRHIDASVSVISNSLPITARAPLPAIITAATAPVIPETLTRNVIDIAAILRKIDGTVFDISRAVTEITAPETATRTSLALPQVRMNGDDEDAPDYYNPRNISPITQAERMAYSFEERVERIVIQVAAEKGTAARIIRAPRDAEIELVNSGGNA